MKYPFMKLSSICQVLLVAICVTLISAGMTVHAVSFKSLSEPEATDFKPLEDPVPNQPAAQPAPRNDVLPQSDPMPTGQISKKDTASVSSGSGMSKYFIDMKASDPALRDTARKDSALQKWGGNVELLKRSGSYCLGLASGDATFVEMDLDSSPREWSLNLSYVVDSWGTEGNILLTDEKGKQIKLSVNFYYRKIIMAGVDSSSVGRGKEIFIQYKNGQLSFGFGGKTSGEYPNFEFDALSRIKIDTGRKNHMWIRRLSGIRLG